MEINTPFTISIKVSGDQEIQELNKRFFKRDYPTDVLSFNMDESSEDNEFHLGEIIVNKDQAQRQSVEFGNDLEHEIAELVAHGVLHLLGVHHEDDNDEVVHGVKVK